MLKWALAFSIEDIAVKTNFHFSNLTQLVWQIRQQSRSQMLPLLKTVSHLAVTNKTIYILLKQSHLKEQT